VPYTIDVGFHSRVAVLNTVSTTQPDTAITPVEDAPESEKRPVVLIAETLGRERGGAEIYLARLVELLAKNGHPVEVFVRKPCVDAMDSKVRVEVVPTMRRFRMVWERRFAERIARRLNGPREVVLSTLPLPGITHYQPHSGLYRAAFEAVGESMAPGVARTVYTLGNGLNWRRHSLVKMQEELLTGARAPKVMTFSRTFRAQLLKSYPNLASSVVTVPLGVDLERFHPGERASGALAGNRGEPDRHEIDQWFPDRTPGQLVLLFAGHNFRLKGLRSLLLAMREAVGRGLNATVLVVGKITGNNRAFPATAALMGLSSRMRFLGTVPDAEMGRLYRSCDALVHPTYSDHCSLVVLEALACGLPVVTTRQNGAAELMESGKQGLILDHANDVAALADSLMQLQDRARLAQMSEAAILLRPRIDFDTHAQQVLAWLTASCGAAS
jgi:UDP-glucose:(heptosyl)LPS alpha-1,3-glucosyltransferase